MTLDIRFGCYSITKTSHACSPWVGRMAEVCEARLFTGQINAFGQCLSSINLVAGASVQPGTVRPGEGDADASLITRFGNDTTQSTSGIEHLNAQMTGDEWSAGPIHRHAIATAVRAIDRRAQFHEAFTGREHAVGIDDKAPGIGASVFGNKQKFPIGRESNSVWLINTARSDARARQFFRLGGTHDDLACAGVGEVNPTRFRNHEVIRGNIGGNDCYFLRLGIQSDNRFFLITRSALGPLRRSIQTAIRPKLHAADFGIAFVPDDWL